MSSETISLLLNWMEMGALLAILFRLSSTFQLIANTQRELRRAIYHLGEHRTAEPGTRTAAGAPRVGLALPSRRAPGDTVSTMDAAELVQLSPSSRL
jgi:hypothetical protein